MRRDDAKSTATNVSASVWKEEARKGKPARTRKEEEETADLENKGRRKGRGKVAEKRRGDLRGIQEKEEEMDPLSSPSSFSRSSLPPKPTSAADPPEKFGTGEKGRE